jgi:D-alanine transaminase
MLNPEQVVYLNGEFVALEDARISVLDRGFIYGDGVYELIPVYGRRPFRLPHHLARLQRSLDGIRLANPHTAAEWTALVAELVAKQPFDDQGVYFQVTRGVAKRDHAFPSGVAPTVFMMSNPLATPSAEQVERGVAVVTAEDNRWRRCDLKTISLVGNVLLRQLAADADALETVMFRDGRLTEASASNVLIVTRGVIVAPPKDNLILPGITYDAAEEFAREAGFPF